MREGAKKGLGMNRAEKQEAIEELATSIKNAAIVFTTSSDRLTVKQSMDLRKKLRAAGAKAQVVKNKLGALSFKRAHDGTSKDAEIAKFISTLKQPTLVVTATDDPVAPAKVIADFAALKEIQGKLTVKGAFFEGSFMNGPGVEALSKMPSRNEVLASLLRLINAPATQLVRVLNASGEQTVRLLEAQRKKLAGE